MARLTWDQAVSDYEKKKQSGNTTTSLPTSGMLTWQQAADEYDQYDEEGYKALGQQRITERRQKDVEREERHVVGDWFRRYNSIMQGVSDYKSRGRAESLIADYEGIKDLAERYGVNDSGQYLDQLNQILDYFNQWGSEDEYNSYIAQRDAHEAMRNFDTKAGEREIAQLESTLREYQSLSRWMTDETGEARAEAIRQQYGGEDEIQALIQQKKQYLNQSKRLQDSITLAGVADPESEHFDPDFADYSGYVSTQSSTGLGKLTSQYGMGYEDLTYEYLNNQDGVRDEIKSRFRGINRSNDESPFEKKGYDYITDDQLAIYNYYYAKDGREAAEKYLDSIQETLSYQKAASLFRGIEDKTALELAFGVAAGLDQFASGVEGLEQAISGEADYIPVSAVQMASSMVREDLGDVGVKLPDWMGGASLGQVGYDATTTTANMAPSIMTSVALGAINPVAGSAAGSALLGASAGGNAYQEMLNLGYDKEQARTYAALVGGSEAGLQYLLGGIGSLGGKLSGNTIGKIMNGVDNAFARTAIQLGGNMLSEGVEEGLQEILTPWFQNLVLHADEDINWSEVAYSSLLGALTAGFMEGGSTIGGEVNTYQTGRQLQEGGITAQRLADIGSTFSADTVAYQLAGRVDENTGAYTIGRLFNEIGAELTEQNKADIVQSLVNKGVAPDHARIHADVMAYIMDGGQLSDIQMRMIEQNDVLAKTMQEVIIDPNSTVNQRIKGFNEAHAALTGKTPEASAPVVEQSAQTEAAAPSGNTAPAAEEIPAESHYESSAEGKTILKSTGEAVSIKEIASIKDGKMALKLDDGRTVDASDVSYSSQDEALVYEAVADMGTNAVAADILVKAFTPGGISAQDYVHGIKEAYTYGQYNFPMKEAANGPFAFMLSAEQRNTAYKLGQIFSGKQVAKEQATVRNNRTVAKNATTDHSVDTGKKVGKVHFDRKGRNFDDVREVSLKTMEQLSAALGVEFYVFESYVNESGQRVYKDENGKEVAAPNGFYDPKDSSIHIDLNAGRDGKGTMLFTVAHELTHFIRQWSPAKFKVLANFLNQQYGEKGKSVSALVDEQIAKAKRNGRTISYGVAYEEVVADSMESMLTDGNVVQMMSDLAQQDKSLWQKICDWFKDLVSDLKAIVDAYTGNTPDSVEGKMVADMQDVIVVLESLYADALVDAGENHNNTTKPQNAADKRYSFAGQNANTADLDALAQAKKMETEGVADETIRQQTGWHKGMDGLWRWEIDDRGMRYDSSGDLRGAESAKWAMEDKANAWDDLQENADPETVSKVRAYNRADIAGDEVAKKELYEELTSGPDAHYVEMYIDAMERAQKMRGKPKGGTLQDYVDHPALFEAYPQLREVGLRFEQMDSEKGGHFDRLDNEIVLNKTLKSEPEDVLVHEIQHAIQKAEGFTRGSSPEIWERRQAGENPVSKYGDAIRDGQAKMDRILNGLPKNVAEQFRQFSEKYRKFSELDSKGQIELMKLSNELRGSPYGKLFGDYFMLEMSMDSWIKNDWKRSGRDLYHNTAGEIEARDASARRLMGPEARRSTKPAGADKNTVFAEDGAIRYSSRDSSGNTLTPEQQKYFKDSEARDGRGNLLVLYHQTDADFTIFDTRREGAGSRDNATPFGIFLKRSDSDIGLRGKKQMKLYANITNPLRVANREDLVYRLRYLSPEYTAIADEIRRLDSEYHNKYEAARRALRDFMTEWRKENPNASRRALYDVPEFNELDDAEDAVLDEWTEKQNELSTRAKETITAALRDAGYDGVFIQEDVGSWGRKTDAIIALNPEQVKNVDNATPTSNPDIRYSARDSEGNHLSDEQSAFFAQSKVRDENGNLLKVYHGTPKKFTTFRQGDADGWGKGIYFTDNREDAAEYGTNIVEAYLNITNPFDTRIKDYNGIGAENTEAYLAFDKKVWKQRFGEYDTYEEYKADGLGADIHEIYTEEVRVFNQILRELGYDGIIAHNSNNINGLEIVAFHESQPKLTSNKAPTTGTDIRYSERVTDQKTLDFLNSQKTVTTYKTMQVVDGKLYPPMAARTNGIYEDYSVLGEWEQATEHPELIKNGNKYKLDKGKGQGSIEAAYNPYMHSSNLVLNDQFSGAYMRDNLVTVECEVPVSELSSGYHAKYAKDSVGWHAWHTGTVAGSLRKARGIERQVFLSRWIKPVRIVPDAEVAAKYKDLLDGTDIAVPDNVVTPSLLNELKKVGVKIKESGRVKYSDRDPEQQRVNRVLEKENAKLKEDVTYLKELLKLQRSVTGGRKFTRTSVEAAATKLMKDASARGQKAELVSLLNGFYEYIAAGEELTWEGVVEQAQPVVQWLMAHESTKKQPNEYAADILRELRGTRISLDDLQKKEVAYQYGSFNEYRKKTMGSIIVTNTGVPLDVQWIELSGLYPNIFNPETTSNDMPAALLDAISTLRNMPAESEFGYDREMAAQDLLHQVYDSYWSVSTLYTVADVKQREINRLKAAHYQRMADLRETHRENTAKLKQQHSEDLKRVRTEMRNAADARMEKTVQKYQESRQRGIESRNKTAMRHKIQRVVSDLNQYLLNGTKDRHVPIGLQKVVAEALDAVNMDTVGAEDRIARLNRDLMKAKKPDQIQEISRKIDNIRAMGDRMSDRLKALHDAYDEIKNDEDPMMSNVYDDGLSAHMMTLIVEVGDTPLRDMTMHQLECVYDVYQIVLTTVRNANKAFKAAKSESIASLGNMAMMEVRGIGGKKQYGMNGMEGIKSFGWNNLKPVYAFEHIGSKTLIELFNNVRAGEDVWAVDVTEAREYYLDKAKRYKYNSWDFAKRHTFKSTSGMDFSLNLEQIMSLYAYSKRDQAADHLRRGGIVIDETTEVTMKTKLGIPVKFNPTEATAYNISDMTLAEIVGTLTPEQKGFVDEMQDYLSTVMGGKGNEVSLAMYGIKLFKEKFYFPLKSAPQFMAKAKEQQQGEVKIKNAGFSKQTVKKASNPIVLTPFMSVWADHVNEMSMYHAFVLPMEDFYRVYNFKTPTSEGTATQSVEMTIQNAYGKGATKYIDQLLKDLNGGARTDSTTGIINKMTGLFKKGAVFASLSVVVQQPSAIARATALIDTKYFIGPKVDHKKHQALWAEVTQYAPVAIIKEMGYFDTNMGKSTQDFILGKEYSGFYEKMKALVTDSNYRDEILSKAPALADELAWCSIWEAVKRETVAKNPGMAANSDEFLQKAGQRFTEVITKTQVYDSVLSRSALMRSKDTGMKMATAFMAEPTTSINMIADALLKGKRGNRKYARGAIGAVIASQILNSILVSFVYAGRDDDEDETYLEKYLGTLTGELLDSMNPATYIPFIKDIISIVQGYDVERSDMAVVSDLWNAWQKLGSDKLSPYRKVEDFVGSVAQICGLPVKNVMRDARGIYQTIASFMSGQKTTKAGIGYAVQSAVTGQTVSNQQQLYEAYLSGDKNQISRVEARFKNQSAINTAIRAALRENDSRIRVAAEARVNGNLTEYTRLAKEIISEGHFTQDNVVAAINAEINAMSKSDNTSAPKSLGLYKAEDFATAISGGDSAMASAVRDDIIQTAQKNGKTADEAEKGFISDARSSMKEQFLGKGITETQAINALVAYCGETGEEARKRVSEWAFEEEYGFTYGEKVQKFKEGEISAAELKGVLIDVDGKTDDEAASSIVSYSRDGYEAGFFSRDETAELMMQYGGLTRSEAEAKLRYIDFKIANPDVYADDAWIDEYYKEVQSSGISIDLFVEYRNKVKSMTGTNKKAQRMAVIDSLPISNDQKDALYFAEGWASSKLYEAPWR